MAAPLSSFMMLPLYPLPEEKARRIALLPAGRNQGFPRRRKAASRPGPGGQPRPWAGGERGSGGPAGKFSVETPIMIDRATPAYYNEVPHNNLIYITRERSIRSGKYESSEAIDFRDAQPDNGMLPLPDGPARRPCPGHDRHPRHRKTPPAGVFSSR